MASARSRSGQGFGLMISSRPSFFTTPRIAAACPRGMERSMMKASFAGMSFSPWSKSFSARTLSIGQSEIFIMARFFVTLPSRRDSLTRMAGGEFLLGTISTYMDA